MSEEAKNSWYQHWVSLGLETLEAMVRANDVTFIPPGVVHEFHCTGTERLTFLVITSPPTDDEPQPR